MCGIAGYYCWGNVRPPIEITKGLLLDNERRGKDAAGVAYLAGNSIRVAKDGQRAESFVKNVKDERWNVIGQSPIVLLHARAKTKGAATENANNHPVFGLGWVVTHNGVIRNDDELFEFYGNKRFAEVDTAALPLVLSKGSDYLTSLRNVTTLSGDVTAAVWSDTLVDHLALVRLGGNDLFLFLDETNEILYWSSTFSGANIVAGPSLGPLRFTTVSHLPENRIIVLSPEGVKLLKISRNAFNPPRRSTGTGNPTGASTRSSKSSTASTAGAKVGANNTSSIFKWSSMEEDEAVRSGKPTPILTDVQPTRYSQSVEYITAFFQANPAVNAKALPTGYGNWWFTRTKQDGKDMLEREFKPHKRIKRYWSQVFQDNLKPEDYKQLNELPWPKSKTPTPLDGVFAIECFNEVTSNPNWGKEVISIPGFMCPWCGIHGVTTVWQRFQWRCWYCNILSCVWKDEEMKERKEVMALG